MSRIFELLHILELFFQDRATFSCVSTRIISVMVHGTVLMALMKVTMIV